MKLALPSLGLASLLAASALAGRPEDLFHKVAAIKQRFVESRQQPVTSFAEARRNVVAGPLHLNDKTKKFAVNGTGIPDVDFDVGESYAGLLPISSKANETRQLYFWYFPSTDPEATDEIAVWFNGGPGCSSLSGFLTENGPFLYQSGTKAPTKNPYAWNKVTNYVWVEQPVGVGYSQGKPDIHNELELANEFKGFWKNFVDTFDLHKRKVYLTGESYAGFYVPYIANSFITDTNKNYFNLKGIAINDPIISSSSLQQQVPILPYVDYWSKLFYLNTSFTEQLRAADASPECGYKQYRDKYFKFPAVPQPWGPVPDPTDQKCDILDGAYSAALEVNPCFNIYHISDTCPFTYGHLGIVNSGDYSPPGAVVYFNRTDVRKAINAPLTGTWYQCTPVAVFLDDGDRSPGPALDGTLTNVIEKTNNTIVGSGALDLLLSTNGTLFALQNTTWNGGQGLSAFPSKPFFSPYHSEPNQGAQAGAGNLGVWQYDRGLTFYDVQLAGHEVPGYAAGAGLRSIQLLTGRIKDLGDTTTPLP